MIPLSLQDILNIHKLIVNQTGGSPELRDKKLLLSAINSPFQTFDSKDLYPSIEAKAAQLCFAIINNHPFIDGNKRTGILAMATFLELNGTTLNTSDKELIKVGLGIASGNISYDNLLEWVNGK